MAIKLNKTDEGTNVVLDVEGKYSTQVMTDKVLEFCQEMLKDSNEFDSQSREQVFNLIYHYIKNNHRILYSPISNLIYGWFEEYEIEEAEKNLATMLNNLQSVSSYIETEEYNAFCGAQRTPMRFRADAVRSITDALNRLLLWINSWAGSLQYSA